MHLAVPELLAELDGLASEAPPASDPAFPFVLSAGERRSFTANTIIRDPAWRKRDAGGALRVSPADAADLGVADGDLVRVVTRRGRGGRAGRGVRDDAAGHVSLPNGLGLDHPGEDGRPVVTGAAPNELTVERGPRLAGRHAVAQARARPARAGRGPVDAAAAEPCAAPGSTPGRARSPGPPT